MLVKVTEQNTIDKSDRIEFKGNSIPEAPHDTFATTPIEPGKRPPKNGIALALGGGAARGWAHIGVLRALDEANIPISMIAGTSIGALVGGCYLAGKLDELEEFARSLKRTNILRFLDFRLGGSGLISGSKLASRMIKDLGEVTIESLDRAFVAIATDIDNAHEIWLHDGPIIDAIRASYALPGIFNPVQVNGRRLVDGALVNPVPVSVCRAHEANLVMAVNLNGETLGRGAVVRCSHYDTPHNGAPAAAENGEATRRKEYARFGKSALAKENLGISGVMMESFNIIQDRISRARLAGDPPDYTIRPRLREIGLSDFHRADETIALGYGECKRRIAQLVDSGEIILADVM